MVSGGGVGVVSGGAVSGRCQGMSGLSVCEDVCTLASAVGAVSGVPIRRVLSTLAFGSTTDGPSPSILAQILGCERLHTRDVRHTHRLLCRHVLAIRSIQMFAHTVAVMIFE